jgi:hypothetical protein
VFNLRPRSAIVTSCEATCTRRALACRSSKVARFLSPFVEQPYPRADRRRCDQGNAADDDLGHEDQRIADAGLLRCLVAALPSIRSSSVAMCSSNGSTSPCKTPSASAQRICSASSASSVGRASSSALLSALFDPDGGPGAPHISRVRDRCLGYAGCVWSRALGGMAERSKAHAWRACWGAAPRGVHGLDASHHVDLSRRALSVCAHDRQQRNSSNQTTLQGSHRNLPIGPITLYHYIARRYAQALLVPAGGATLLTSQRTCWADAPIGAFLGWAEHAPYN